MESMTEKKKVYGLIIPKKAKDEGKRAGAPPAFNVFGDDDSEEEEGSKCRQIGPFGVTSSTTKLKKQSQMDIEKAMHDDPNVYEYDNIYDDIQASKQQVGGKQEEAKSKKSKKPIFISGLLKAAEERKKESERRNERKVQKEREAEGEKFADKESFVTSAYKQKMLDMQKEADEERRKEELDDLTDVTKQKDLGGFYRYLYRQTAGKEGEEKSDHAAGTKESGDKDKKVKKSESGVLGKRQDKESSQAVEKQKPNSSSTSSSSSSDESSNESRDKKRGKRNNQSDKDKNSPTEERYRKERKEKYKDRSCSPENRGGKNKETYSSSERDKVHSKSESKYRKSSPPTHDKDKTESCAEKESYSKYRERKRKSRSSSPLERNSKKSSRVTSPADKQRLHSPSPDNFLSKSSQRKDQRNRESQSSDRTIRTSSTKRNASSPSPPRERLDRNPNPSVDAKKNTSSKLEGPISKVSRGDKPIPPHEKVYPHHNSPKDIEEARKRYLVRKLEREKARGS